MMPVISSLKIFTKQLFSDGMLIMMVVAPVLAGMFFKFLVPVFENLLTGYFSTDRILADYYVLIDLFVVALTPYMFCFAASMTMLDEYDQNVTQHLIVTPLMKRGYLFSRLIMITSLATIYSIGIILLLSLTRWTFIEAVFYALVSSLIAITYSLALFSFSNNKVEGLALAKLSGLFLMGLPIPFFITNSNQYLVSFLPSFWMAKIKLEFSWLYILLLGLSILMWYLLLFRKFYQKLSN
jgi:fluoroquinolone transport system permease protein